MFEAMQAEPKVVENQEGAMEAASNLRALHDKVVIYPIKTEDKTDGGIIIPDLAQKKVSSEGGWGKVVAVGPGWIDDQGHRHPVEVKVGDTVAFVGHAGVWLKYKGFKYLFGHEREIVVREKRKGEK